MEGAPLKRGTPDHPKTLRLARTLGVPLPMVVGYLELLFHWTARFAPRGDVGKFSDADIEVGVGWEGAAGELVSALEAEGWIDAHHDPRVRLVVHDWHEHADDAVKKVVQRLVEKGTPGFFSAPDSPSPAEVEVLGPKVYFIQGEQSRRIKIGYTEGLVESRIASLQTGSQERLLALGWKPGTRSDERTLHRQFAKLSMGGEWFNPGPELLTYVSSAVVRRRPPSSDDGGLPEPEPEPEPEPAPAPPPSPPAAGAADPPARAEGLRHLGAAEVEALRLEVWHLAVLEGKRTRLGPEQACLRHSRTERGAVFSDPGDCDSPEWLRVTRDRLLAAEQQARDHGLDLEQQEPVRYSPEEQAAIKAELAERFPGILQPKAVTA